MQSCMQSASAVTCLAGFREHTYPSGQPLVLDVMIRSHMPGPVRLSALHVHFSDPTYDTMCLVADPAAHLDPGLSP